MFTHPILIVVLLVPVVANAEDFYRWRDARGQIHYSNDQQGVPEGAKAVTRRIGEIGGSPIGATVEPVSRPEAQRMLGQALAPAPWRPEIDSLDGVGLYALPHRSVDLDRRSWFDVDHTVGRQWDVEAWLRGATTKLERRKIGL